MSSMKPMKPAQARPLQQNLWMQRVGGASELLAAVAIDDTDPRRSQSSIASKSSARTTRRPAHAIG